MAALGKSGKQEVVRGDGDPKYRQSAQKSLKYRNTASKFTEPENCLVL